MASVAFPRFGTLLASFGPPVKLKWHKCIFDCILHGELRPGTLVGWMKPCDCSDLYPLMVLFPATKTVTPQRLSCFLVDHNKWNSRSLAPLPGYRVHILFHLGYRDDTLLLFPLKTAPVLLPAAYQCRQQERKQVPLFFSANRFVYIGLCIRQTAS